jgi:hypothetical protein
MNATIPQSPERVDDYEARTGFQRWQGGDIAGSKYFPKTSWSMLAVIAVLCGVFVVTGLHRLNHAELWGHLNVGRWIVENRSLAAADPLGIEEATESFLNVPWLTQVLGYGIYIWLGGEGLVLAHALLTTAAVAAMMLAIRARGLPLISAVLGGVAAMVLSIPMFASAGPHLVGAVALPIVLLGARRLRCSWRPAIWLPVGFALWVNLDASVALGLLALTVLCLAEVFAARRRLESWRGVTRDIKAQRFAVTLIVCCLAAMIHPAGPRAAIGLIHQATAPAAADVPFWQPIVLTSLSGGLFFGSLLATGLILRFSPRRFRPHEIALLLLFGAAALMHVTLLLWWAVVWTWIMTPHAAALVRRWRRRIRANADPDEDGEEFQFGPTTMQTLLAMGFVFMAILLSPASEGLISNRPRGEARLCSEMTPIYLAHEIERRQLDGRFFAPYDWSDYLTWRSDGHLQPMMHSLTPLAREEVWTDFKHLDDGGSHWLKIADFYEIDYLVLSREWNAHLIQSALEQDESRVTMVFQDELGIILRVLRD